MDTNSQPPITPEPAASQPAQKPRGRGFPWAGIILIVLGIVFFLQQFGYELHNWWALFILIPAVSALIGMAASIRSSGKFGAVARSSAGTAIILFTLTVMFLLDLDWSKWWPLMMMAPGISLLLGSIPSEDQTQPARSFSWLGHWIGADVALLGLVFLLNNLRVFDLPGMFGTFRWWTAFIIFPGVCSLILAWLYTRQPDHKSWPALILSGIGIVTVLTGVLLLTTLSTELMGAVILIAAGLLFIIYSFRRQ